LTEPTSTFRRLQSPVYMTIPNGYLGSDSGGGSPAESESSSACSCWPRTRAFITAQVVLMVAVAGRAVQSSGRPTCIYCGPVLAPVRRTLDRSLAGMNATLAGAIRLREDHQYRPLLAMPDRKSTRLNSS